MCRWSRNDAPAPAGARAGCCCRPSCDRSSSPRYPRACTQCGSIHCFVLASLCKRYLYPLDISYGEDGKHEHEGTVHRQPLEVRHARSLCIPLRPTTRTQCQNIRKYRRKLSHARLQQLFRKHQARGKRSDSPAMPSNLQSTRPGRVWTSFPQRMTRSGPRRKR